MLQELNAQAVAFMRAFDESWNVGNDVALLVRQFADGDHTEVWLQGREFVVSDLRLRGGDARDQRALADIRIADDANTRQQLQFKPQSALFAGTTKLMLARCLMCRSSKMLVAASAAPAARNHDALVG